MALSSIQSGIRFADTIFKHISSKENIGVLFSISLYVDMVVSAKTRSQWVRVVAWCWIDDHSLTELKIDNPVDYNT